MSEARARSWTFERLPDGSVRLSRAKGTLVVLSDTFSRDEWECVLEATLEAPPTTPKRR